VTKPPNIIVIMLDQMKATASSLYGNTQCPTPELERLAAGGITYDLAVTPHPLCIPARIALWTSQFPDRTGCRTNVSLLPAGRDHAFRRWHDAGFRTGLIGKNHCFAEPDDLACFDVWCEISHRGLPNGVATKGMDWVRDLEAVTAAHATRQEMPQSFYPHAATDFPADDYGTALVTDQACAFLEGADGPFALWLSYPDPHTPYEVSRAAYEALDWRALTLGPAAAEDDPSVPERNRVMRRILGAREGDLDELRQALATYYAMTMAVDTGLGKLLDRLETLGLAEDTIVVFCADHGDFSGEHAMMNKGGLFYDCLTRVPLVVRWPGRIPAGERVSDPVNLIDIVPTLFALQGLPASPEWEGRPLPRAVPDATGRIETFSLYGAGGPPFRLADLEAMRQPRGNQALMASLIAREAEGERSMIRTRRHKLVHDPVGDDLDELYDLENDPHEIRNLAGEASQAALEADLRRRLLDFRGRLPANTPQSVAQQA